MVEGLAQRIVRGDVPQGLQGTRIYSLDMGLLLAGTQMRGQFEQRMKDVLAEAKDPNIILFIDEMHMVIGAGATGEGNMDASNLLKPMLARGEVRVLALCCLFMS